MYKYEPASDLLKDRVILVTGAGDGIGRAASIALAAHAATIVLLGKTIPKLEQVYDEIVNVGGPEPAIYPLHLEGATPRDYQEMATKLKEELGGLDGILHNAAALPYLSRIKDYEPEDWVKNLQVNLTAPFMLTQACLPLLLESEEGVIIFTSDEVGRRSKAYWGAYAAAKFGIEGLMQTLAAELEGTSIRVNSFDPGPTRTAMRKQVFPGEDNVDVKTPESLQPAYLWLFGPDSKDVRGQALSYDQLPISVSE